MQVPVNSKLKTYTLGGKSVTIGPLKGRHMIKAQTDGGPKAGNVELGFRAVAAALADYMEDGAPTYDELLDFDLDEVSPLLDLIGK